MEAEGFFNERCASFRVLVRKVLPQRSVAHGGRTGSVRVTFLQAVEKRKRCVVSTGIRLEREVTDV